MMMEIKTESGSTYLIDTTLKTWARVVPPRSTGALPLRTTSGTYQEYEIGKTLRILAEPLTPGADVRWIETSPIMGWIMDPETGEPCTWQFDEEGEPYVLEERMQGCQTEEQAKHEAFLDAAYQKLYENPESDPEMWELIFGPEPEYTEEEIEEMDSTAIPAELFFAESHRSLNVIATETMKRLRTGEPRLSKAEEKAIWHGDYRAASKVAAHFDMLKGGPPRMELDPATGEEVLRGGDKITDEEVADVLARASEFIEQDPNGAEERND